MEENNCVNCWVNYDMFDAKGDFTCAKYHEFISLGIVGRDRICGKLEVILRGVEKVEAGSNNVSYPHIVEKIVDILKEENKNA